jgi:SAM-dependent methyltransferase
MTTQDTTFRRRFYNNTGGAYEAGRYGDRHMDGYRSFRNDTLLGILRSAYGDSAARILEVGCGTGPSLQHLGGAATRYSLFGMDASDTMLRQAAQKASALPNAPKLSLGDAGRLPYTSGAFDAVYATRFIHQFSHDAKRQLWTELQRVVRHDGLIILEFYARPYHWLRYHLGAAKGRGTEAYFRHYPSTAEVRDIIDGPFEIHPLRLPGSKLLATALGTKAMRQATRAAGLAFGSLLMDEYFVVARKR